MFLTCIFVKEIKRPDVSQMFKEFCNKVKILKAIPFLKARNLLLFFSLYLYSVSLQTFSFFTLW